MNSSAVSFLSPWADLTVTEEVVDHMKRVIDTGADLRLEPLCTDGELL